MEDVVVVALAHDFEIVTAGMGGVMRNCPTGGEGGYSSGEMGVGSDGGRHVHG